MCSKPVAGTPTRSSPNLLEPAQVPLGAEVRHVRHSAHPLAAQRDDPGRRRCGRRVAELRQHAVRSAGAVLRRPAVVAHHRLARRADAALPAGAADARRGHATRRSPTPTASSRRSPTTWAVGDTLCRPRSGVFLGRTEPRRPARRCPTRTSAAPARADRLPGMRLLHDGLSLRRQEHAGQELPWARGNQLAQKYIR